MAKTLTFTEEDVRAAYYAHEVDSRAARMGCTPGFVVGQYTAPRPYEPLEHQTGLATLRREGAERYRRGKALLERAELLIGEKRHDGRGGVWVDDLGAMSPDSPVVYVRATGFAWGWGEKRPIALKVR